jgi:uncharacterized protein (TIGR00645 family)
MTQKDKAAPNAPDATTSIGKRVELAFEAALFNSRWLMAPFYFGLIVSLAVLLFKFFVLLAEFIIHIPKASEGDVILGVLSMIDLSLTGNLVLIVVFSGYENFVSRIDPRGHPDWPEWMTKIDFSGLKQKLLASIVAISAIQVLKAFIYVEKYSSEKLAWLVGIHLVFVASTVLLALSDKLTGGHGEDKANH